MIIWDWHGDEYNRVKFYLPDFVRYIGETVPHTDKLVTADGHWLHKIPKANRANVVVYPCVKDVEHIKALGYKLAFCKDKEQSTKWGAGAIILPPDFDSFNEPKTIQRNVCSLVHNYELRDKKNYDLTVSYGVVNYGFPNNPTFSPESIINTSKYLFHAKEVGYLCNVVIKAINLGTPVIFTSKSYQYGYKDYITNPLIADSKEQFDAIINSDAIYKEQIELYKTYKQNIIDLQNQTKIDINQIWKTSNIQETLGT
jgi:hypothetical protein